MTKCPSVHWYEQPRRSIRHEAAKRRFGSFAELNAWLAERCRTVWSQSQHPEHGQLSIAEMLEHERTHLLAIAAPFDGYVERPARVSSTCLVTVARNRYSVLCVLVGQTTPLLTPIPRGLALRLARDFY